MADPLERGAVYMDRARRHLQAFGTVTLHVERGGIPAPVRISAEWVIPATVNVRAANVN